jgi:predicted RNA-binding Zn ribbon-like protein
MMKRLLPFLLALSCGTALAQTSPTTAPPDDPLPRLIQERQQMVQQYEEAAAQRNAFLANKPSKKDLQEVVDALKGIIRKDTEIVRAVQAGTLRKTAAVVAENQQVKQLATVAQTDQSSTRERFHDLENQIANLQERDRQRDKKLQDLQATADEATAARTSRELLAAGLAVLCAGLLFYVLKLRGQLSAAPVKRRQ